MTDPIIVIETRFQSFAVPRSVLMKSDYFACDLLRHGNIEQTIMLSRSSLIFKYVLKYLYDENFKFPREYLSELKFYKTNYPCYNKDYNSDVILNVNGKIFSINCKQIMNNSDYFSNQLESLLVGEVFYVDDNPDVFKHVIRRIQNDGYIIPGIHNKLIEKYGLKPLNIDSIKRAKISCCGKKFILPIDIILQCPMFLTSLETNGHIVDLMFDSKIFKEIIMYLSKHIQYCNEKHQHCYQLLGLNPAYYTIEYQKCTCSPQCQKYKKHKIYREKGKVHYVEHNTRPYCLEGTCRLCDNVSYYSIYCKEHRCSKFMSGCCDPIVEGTKFCEKHQ